ncbi:phage major capsid protein [Listeria booriae]|uniref:phage major capsid protein n=1 Tax=Listeria booriae TaxID=1552123 RepID=UPI00164DE0CD|nr:phage major capsid protein [Listeria booriae]MBC6128079.1 phage major capsid protein [Listeria booriae]
MINPDGAVLDARNALIEAFNADEPQQMEKGFENFAAALQRDFQKQANDAARIAVEDSIALTNRGVNMLTGDEKAFYDKLIENKGLDNTEVTFPITVFERVFEYLEGNHELLKAIDFVNVTGITEWLYRKSDAEGATWSELTSEIQKELQNGFDKMTMNLFKLSAFIPIYNSTLELGAAWIDKFIVTLLSESLFIGLEKAIIAGTGKNQPIGMLKDMEKPVSGGGYDDKEAVTLADLTPKSLGRDIMAPLTLDGKRAVPNVLLVVNPHDYWSIIFPAMTTLNAAGTYVQALPISATIVQSRYVDKGKMVAGMAQDYFMGIGSSGNIKSSEHYRFLEDQTVYVARQLANGRPKENEAFLVFDIAGIGEDTP